MIPTDRELIYSDTECYPNWCCVVFKDGMGDHVKFTYTDKDKIDPKATIAYYINQCTLVGFNFLEYDVIILRMMLNGKSCAEIHQASTEIIQSTTASWEIIRKKQLYSPEMDVIDIMNVLPGKAGLKLYSSRISFKRLQELPFDPRKPVDELQQSHLLDYCCNDTDMTEALFLNIKGEIDLRISMSKQYDVDLRSKGGSQIAAVVLSKEYERLTKDKPIVPDIAMDIAKVMSYETPKWIEFKTEPYQRLLKEIQDDTFRLNCDTGHLILGDSVKNRIFNLADLSTQMGIGGLHSIDAGGYYEASDTHALIDLDVASMYPSMILNAGWFPRHLGKAFLTIYREIVDKRLAAKHRGDKLIANSLKLVINSSFGLFSNKYSVLYDPNLLLNVTLSGQLSLLMLIERLELHGWYAVSANTDGLVINIERSEVPKMREVVKQYERDSGLIMEETWYSKYVRMNVNNYFTILEDRNGN